jgi:hypothetical protein
MNVGRVYEQPAATDEIAQARRNAWAVVAGGALLHLTLGSIYSCPNLGPYFASYVLHSAGDGPAPPVGNGTTASPTDTEFLELSKDIKSWLIVASIVGQVRPCRLLLRSHTSRRIATASVQMVGLLLGGLADQRLGPRYPKRSLWGLGLLVAIDETQANLMFPRLAILIGLVLTCTGQVGPALPLCSVSAALCSYGEGVQGLTALTIKISINGN